MKKLLFLAVAVTIMGTAFAKDGVSLPSPQSVNTPLAGPPHIEYRSYGFYGVVNYATVMNIKPEHDGYNDAYTLSGFTASAGFQWRKESAVGVGFSYLRDPNNSFSQIPVFIEFRSHFLRSRLTPFTDIQLGYSVPFGSVNAGSDYVKIITGGITAGASAGIRIAFSRNIGMNLSVGYQLIQLKEVERGFAGQAATRLPEFYQNLKLSLGFNF